MEWLETDGLGGFAMGTAVGMPTRRYHSLLTSATTSPARRFTLVNAVEAVVHIGSSQFPISTLCFDQGVWHPNGVALIESFNCQPWPKWTFRIPNGPQIHHQLFMIKDRPAIFMNWQLSEKLSDATLIVRPLITGRFYHSLHHRNDQINLETIHQGQIVSWQPYHDTPKIFALSDATFKADPLWIENVLYDEDRLRGSDYHEDLASPGIFQFDLSMRSAYLAFSSLQEVFSKEKLLAEEQFNYHMKSEEKRRGKMISALEIASDHYIVKRGSGKTIIAGYPWFADWGRDSFISLRGLCLANNRLSDAESILVEWSKTISQGMLPNRFLDDEEEAEYNSVDASLWFIIACYDYLQRAGKKVSPETQKSLTGCISQILEHFIQGTRYNIAMDPADSLLRAGIPIMQLTWMDAKIGDKVITPRIGKPVEIQALWINALDIAGRLLGKYRDIYSKAMLSFQLLFWNDSKKCLYDVIDCDHEVGKRDASLRPNQIFAVGGLPLTILDSITSRAVVDAVEASLLTPHGLRTLAPNEPGYCPRYIGGSFERDSAYHQGTVWPWLMGPFIEAWVRVRNNSESAKREAKARFFEPMISSLNNSGLGHLSEIHDAQAPHVNRGCPFQAWSVGEALRIEREVLS